MSSDEKKTVIAESHFFFSISVVPFSIRWQRKCRELVSSAAVQETLAAFPWRLEKKRNSKIKNETVENVLTLAWRGFSDASILRNIVKVSRKHSYLRFTGRDKQSHVISSRQMKVQRSDWTKEAEREREKIWQAVLTDVSAEKHT